jgi:hypothetical protein
LQIEFGNKSPDIPMDYEIPMDDDLIDTPDDIPEDDTLVDTSIMPNYHFDDTVKLAISYQSLNKNISMDQAILAALRHESKLNSLTNPFTFPPILIDTKRYCSCGRKAKVDTFLPHNDPNIPIQSAIET